MSVIEINKLTKTYNDIGVPVHALSDVNFIVEKAEFLAIVGPSGSGKTTLLNMIGGLDKPSSGEILISGKPIKSLSEKELIRFRLHHIGFVFQHFNLIPVLSARENVEFVMLLQEQDKHKRYARAMELLEIVGLTEKANHRPNELSGGQQQRVAVARALASNPDFVLADEPTANLDSASAESLLDLMEEMNKKMEMTFIFATHDEKVIRRARRVVTLVDGRIDSDERR
ncbi:MAG: ABC transporter ATP-binding protein [Calditrichaeota bacterium]|nr:ABC transporter ATP-binding protein [Calditrichota bacterium]